MTDLTEYVETPPSPSAMIESMRAFGYTLPAALADLVDNSISAGAQNVRMTFHWGGPDSWVSILDDGSSMSEEELTAAMRLGSQNPTKEREKDDLGRFGLGLKTASFSQCRRLTVRSRDGEGESTRRWDLDFIAERATSDQDRWYLLKSAAPESVDRLQFPDSGTGTVVLWEKIDRIIGDEPVSDEEAQRRFFRHINATNEYVAMVFHRFLEGSRPQLKIFINGTRVEAWDPFLEDHPCTDKTPEETITVDGYSVVVRGSVLPHKDRLGQELHRIAAGPQGWNAQQGFYVYRNRRLLVPGSWLKLGLNRPWTKEEHYKLARIRVDIPNTMDLDWQIDVKKSIAVPPAVIGQHLFKLASDVRRDARTVFAHRGQYGPRAARSDVIHPWSGSTRNGRMVYRIDRKHPLVARTLQFAGDERDSVETMLQVIEETVPVQRIWLDTAEKPDAHSLPFQHETRRQIQRKIRLTLEAYIDQGHARDAAIDHLLKLEEFADHTDLIEQLRKERP